MIWKCCGIPFRVASPPVVPLSKLCPRCWRFPSALGGLDDVSVACEICRAKDLARIRTAETFEIGQGSSSNQYEDREDISTTPYDGAAWGIVPRPGIYWRNMKRHNEG